MADAFDINVKREPTNLSELVNDVITANQPLARRKDQTISVTAEIEQSVPCDPDRMREAIDNLLSNAIKYSPIGGPIQLDVVSRCAAMP